MILPSEKLLSAVLKIDSLEINQHHTKYPEKYIAYRHFKDKVKTDSTINIHELMHMMKEWAFNQGVEIVTYKRAHETYRALPKGLKGVQTPEITENTEFEAVTKACEYILKETK